MPALIRRPEIQPPVKLPMSAATNGIQANAAMVQRVDPADTDLNVADSFILEDKRVVPWLVPILRASAKPLAYFVAYPDIAAAERPQLQVEFLWNGEAIARQSADLPPPNSSGAIPMLVGVAMRPGSTELRITVRQGESAATQSVQCVVTKE